MELNLINKDVFKGLKDCESKSVDMVLLDPPYYRVVDQTWDKQWFTFDEYREWFIYFLNDLDKVVKQSATCWVFGMPYQLSKLLPDFEYYGWTFKQQIVIDKGLKSVAGRSGESLKQFPTATEHIYMFFKESRPIIRNLLQHERKVMGMSGVEVNKHLGKATSGGGTFSTIASTKKPLEYLNYPTRKDWVKLQEIFDLPEYDDLVYTFNSFSGFTDVWSDFDFYKIKNKIHPTQKPVELYERIIRTGRTDQVVLDCFLGSGSSLIASQNLEVSKFIGIEIDETMINKAKDRFTLHITDLQS